MPNPNLFNTRHDITKNEAGGIAFKMSPEHALAQYAVTGTLYNTYYVDDKNQLEHLLELLKKVSPEFVAKTAIYARQEGYMKDVPAALCAWLAANDISLLKKVFFRVIDNPVMLRKFVQFVRSGVFGRKSFGYAPKKLINQYLTNSSFEVLFKGSIGKNPSLADVIKMTHPKPKDKTQEVFFRYICGYDDINLDDLPQVVQEYEVFKKNLPTDIPKNVDFRFLTALPLTKDHWKKIALTAPWHMTRMNLNTFKRYGVLDDPEIVSVIAERLQNEELIRKNKVFPYQLFITYMSIPRGEMPKEIIEALKRAVLISMNNVPDFDPDLQIAICPDVSGSMNSPIAANRQGIARYIDVASIFTAAIKAKTNNYIILPFNHDLMELSDIEEDDVFTLASKIRKMCNGGTNCSLPMDFLVSKYYTGKPDIIIYISDNESWIDTDNIYRENTETNKLWKQYKQKRNPNAKLICWDIAPYKTVQVKDEPDVLNIGGFSDRIMDIIYLFINNKLEGKYWKEVIDSIDL
ncbi:MAG: ribonucleoprotein [Candidatus Woesearchaeota archaeon]|nr:MAG: ribonucleoprotein [Candidatus Woesearchaeota archaeon]